eukprot:TRINITY_DN28567_c0_g1_i1.p1 TRINITY_DN28567_c0_g1~~TRINITY_DN28567_c0_g1_i1.p1  ORF type:complete len:778 (+),score=293.19 TRINITY_DN28567_c0_g1_i1:48-2381(+)
MAQAAAGQDWEAQLKAFYRDNAPSKADHAPELLERFRGREVQMMQALRKKYAGGGGVAGSRKEAPQRSSLSDDSSRPRQPDPGVPQIVLGGWPREGPKQPQIQVSEPPPASEPPAPVAQVPFTVSDEVVDGLVLAHLRALNLKETADSFEQETGAKALSLDIDAGVSPLQMLFARRRTTAQCIRSLLTDTRERLRASAHHYFDSDTMDRLDAMAHEPMWSPPRRVFTRASSEGAVSRHSEIARIDAARLGVLHAASLNQLVERITKLVIKPHGGPRPEERAAEEHFALSFLRTYKLFCSPHVLLAKLFQRWFVPLGLPLTDGYSNHYVFIAKAPPKTSAKWWDAVSAKLKCRVSSILLAWVEQFPGDWDATMVEALETFIDDNFYEPTCARPRVPTELLQYAHVLKVSLAKLVTKAERAEDDSDEESVGGEGEKLATYSLLSTALDAERLAEQLTAADQRALCRVKVRELLDFTKNEMHYLFLDAQGQAGGSFMGGGVADDAARGLVSPQSPVQPHSGPPSPHSTGFVRASVSLAAKTAQRATHRHVRRVQRAQHLAAFLQRSVDVERWVAVEVLTTDDEDERRVKCEKLVRLAFRLLERNNFQTLRAVVAGLQHPTVARMSKFLSTVDGWDRLLHLSSEVLETSPFCVRYKKMLSGLTDAQRREHPPIPWLGCWVSELHLVDETEPTVLTEDGAGYIHWRKFQVISDIYKRFSALQELQNPPTEPIDSSIQHYLRHSFERSKRFDSLSLMTLSVQHEAPESDLLPVRRLKALPPEP